MNTYDHQDETLADHGRCVVTIAKDMSRDKDGMEWISTAMDLNYFLVMSGIRLSSTDASDANAAGDAAIAMLNAIMKDVPEEDRSKVLLAVVSHVGKKLGAER
jgi:hypothetical protein